MIQKNIASNVILIQNAILTRSEIPEHTMQEQLKCLQWTQSVKIFPAQNASWKQTLNQLNNFSHNHNHNHKLYPVSPNIRLVEALRNVFTVTKLAKQTFARSICRYSVFSFLVAHQYLELLRRPYLGKSAGLDEDAMIWLSGTFPDSRPNGTMQSMIIIIIVIIIIIIITIIITIIIVIIIIITIILERVIRIVLTTVVSTFNNSNTNTSTNTNGNANIIVTGFVPRL